MITKLYRKLYLYVVLSILLSMGLTAFTLSLVFDRGEEAMRRQFFLDQVSFAQHLIQQEAEKPNAAQNFQKEVERIARFQRWRLSFWKHGKAQFQIGPPQKALPQNIVSQLTPQNDPLVVEPENGGPPTVLTLLDSQTLEKGYLQISLDKPPGGRPWIKGLFKRPPPPPGLPSFPGKPGPPPGPPRFLGFIPFPLLPFIFSLGFLGLMLIPFARYLIRPIKELNDSIERVAMGDFSTPIVVKPKSEFSDIAAAFNRMVDKVQEMLQEKQRLIADVSHELRSPLARMRVSLELLDKEGKGKKKYIDKSVKELEELDRMIEDILDISALELSAQNFPLEKIKLNKLLEDSLDAHQLMFQEHGLQLKLQGLEQEYLIRGHYDQLERALNNLFSNLVKYAPQGSQVDLRLEAREDAVCFTLRDRGPGVKAEEQARILEPFYRTDDSRSRKTGGTGLGLAIVQKIMDLHKGRIELGTPGDGEGGLVTRLYWPLSQNETT